jgi:hypothetical protein
MMQLLVRNQAADSAIDRWVVVVLSAAAGDAVYPSRDRSERIAAPGDNLDGNLLHDHEIIRRGGMKEGWLLCEGERSHMGLTEAQTAVVEVSFGDVHDNEYHFVSALYSGWRSA